MCLPEVSTAILHSNGKIDKIVYLKDWEFDDNVILVVTKVEKNYLYLNL